MRRKYTRIERFNYLEMQERSKRKSIARTTIDLQFYNLDAALTEERFTPRSRERKGRERMVEPSALENVETANYLCLAQEGYFISWQMVPFPVTL